MKTSRRKFIHAAVAGSILTSTASTGSTIPGQNDQYAILDKIIAAKVLKRHLWTSPVIIETMELLRFKDNFLCRVRSKEGGVGISVSNNDQMKSLYPVFLNRLQPFFIGKDARNIESLMDEVYVYRSNYKMQNLALWVPLATIEFAILDLLGQLTKKSIGELIGNISNRHIAVYQANGDRGISAEDTIIKIKEEVEKSSAKALKFKVGGRMSNNTELPLGRTEKLIPLVRKTFGDDMVIYADSNGSYTVDEAIRIGKLMQEYKYDFYEEPVPFDWYEETRQVAASVTIPVAGGEQEPSLHMMRWLIANDALQILQPDIFYFGGMVRSMKVALMAQALGKVCTPHISGSGLGYLYMLHFVSAIPNAGPFHEFKGFNDELPFECKTSSLASVDGVITVPSGPGLGIDIDPSFINKHQLVK